jgi:hypothetical protein
VESTTNRRKGQQKNQPYQKGEKVWLERTNVKTTHPTAKLAPRRYEPFLVTKIISLVVFKLKIPGHWNIFDTFHALLLAPYYETMEHGPNYKELAPDLIDGQLEYEVEQVLGARHYSRWWKLQYLMQWKGYSEVHNSWELEENVHAPGLIEEFWNKNPQETEALRSIKWGQEEADPLIIWHLSTTMSSDHFTSSFSSDVVAAFIDFIITSMPPTLPTNDQALTNKPIGTVPDFPHPTMLSLEEVEMIRTGSLDYMPHTPTASKINRMPTLLPMNPGPPPVQQHPGVPFVLYKPLNLHHYPLLIQLPDGGTIEVWYVAFYHETMNPYMMGTMGFGCPIYGALLMAQEDVAEPPDEDSDHVTFEPIHLFFNQINEALQTIGDPGLTADVARYCQITKRRANLRMQEWDLDRRWVDTANNVTQIVRRLKKAHVW